MPTKAKKTKTEIVKAKPFFREATFQREHINVEDRTVELAFSSEEPVDRWFGEEILDHSPGSVRLGRLSDGGPILVDHDSRDHVGVTESVSIGKDRRGRLIARFGKSERAMEVFNDVVDGIRHTVSVGYRIFRAVLVEETDEKDTYRVMDWEPYEVSLVSVPADATVGVGREANEEYELKLETPELENRTMVDKNTPPATPAAVPATPATPAVDAGQERANAKKDERERISQIMAIGNRYEMPDMAREFVDQDKSIDDFRAAVLEKLGDRAPFKPADDADIGLSDRDLQDYSFVRIINALANPKDRRAQEAAAFEIEASMAAADKRGKPAQGILIPTDVLRHKRANVVHDNRDLTAGTATAGGHTVATDLLSGSFIELLRNRMALQALGATIMTDLNGDIAIPRQSGGATGYWVAESGNPTESQQTFDQVTLAPKTVGAFTDYSRKLLLQSSIDVENFVRMDLANVLGLAIDLAGINGSGSSNQPTGVKNTSGIGSVTIASGGSPTYAEIVEFESDVAAANADIGNMAYLIEATMRGSLKTTEKASGTAQFIWEQGDTINGYRSVVSNQVTTNDIFFGNWADLLIAFWSGLDLTVDPYTGATSGTTRIIALQDVDVAVRHPESFSYGA